VFLLRLSQRHVNSVRYIKVSLDRHDDACDFRGTIILVLYSHSIGVRGGVGCRGADGRKVEEEQPQIVKCLWVLLG